RRDGLVALGEGFQCVLVEHFIEAEDSAVEAFQRIFLGRRRGAQRKQCQQHAPEQSIERAIPFSHLQSHCNPPMSSVVCRPTNCRSIQPGRIQFAQRKNRPMQKPLLYVAQVSVRWADMDSYGHVNNTLYIQYLEEARVAWFEKLGIPMNN